MDEERKSQVTTASIPKPLSNKIKRQGEGAVPGIRFTLLDRGD